MTALLDNTMWHTLTGPHARFALGSGGARRFGPGFSPMIALDDFANPDFAAIAPLCEPGEIFYTEGWSGPAPEGFEIDVDAFMMKMVWDGDTPASDPAPDAVPVGPEHAQAALDLALLTKPGLFGIHTTRLGDYVGLFRDGELIAMAGERMWVGDYREVSGICTRPDHQGKGLARRLTLKIVRNQLMRGQTPFLHVLSANETARGLYGRMGFREYRETPVRIIRRV